MKRLSRRLFWLLPVLALALSLSAWAVDTEIAEGGPIISKSDVYDAQFQDVSPEQWFYPYVTASYEYGLIRGRSEHSFAPGEEITVAELLTLSARIRSAYEGENIPAAAEGEVWYAPYVAYLSAKGLLDNSLSEYGAPATRAQLAGIFALSLPESCFAAQNAALVTDAYESGDYITDVTEYTLNQPQILWLYRQGLLTGMDGSGSYWPDQTTTRAEVAAVVTRMVDPSLRVTLDWNVLPPWSAVGKTLAGLIPPPAQVQEAPYYNDTAAIDALIRRMLSSNETSLSLHYANPLTQSDAQAIAYAFTACVKSYCEQMYNAVICQRYRNSGEATLTFYATACLDKNNKPRTGELELYRETTMAKAIEIHDMLWETDQLDKDMSQREVAEVYYRWLCDHCEYDWDEAQNDYSISHIAYSALVNGKSVCDGYTGAYNLLLKLEGIDCCAVSSDEINHIWTVATLDGTEYHIDVTWGDQNGWTDMNYFCMTPSQSRVIHIR